MSPSPTTLTEIRDIATGLDERLRLALESHGHNQPDKVRSLIYGGLSHIAAIQYLVGAENPHNQRLEPQGVVIDVEPSVPAQVPAQLPHASELLSHDLSLLNSGQLRAFNRIRKWAITPAKTRHDLFFRLRGPPGTGKTFLMRVLPNHIRAHFLWSAPTNRAARELGNSVGAPARTTYSILGIKMSHDEDELVLEYGKTTYVPPNSILVVDEGSMVGSKLSDFIWDAANRFKMKVLVVGDPFQLNPIGEIRSKLWSFGTNPLHRATLTKVERYDNQLLALSTRIKTCIRNEDWQNPVVDDHTAEEGVMVVGSKAAMIAEIKRLTTPADFANRKVVAWRNKTVDEYNTAIRQNFGFKAPYCVGERITLAAPMEDAEGEIIAFTDDEFEVTAIADGLVKATESQTIQTWALTCIGQQELVMHIVKRPVVLRDLLQRKATLAREEKNRALKKELWQEYWAINRKFQTVRYNYALTAHRIQGSTVKTIFADVADILVNRTKEEAFRALMVACTRPTTWLITY